MRLDHSFMTTTEFVGSAFWKILIGLIWYKSLLFRPLKHNTTRESLALLFLMTLEPVLKPSK